MQVSTQSIYIFIKQIRRQKTMKHKTESEHKIAYPAK